MHSYVPALMRVAFNLVDFGYVANNCSSMRRSLRRSVQVSVRLSPGTRHIAPREVSTFRYI